MLAFLVLYPSWCKPCVCNILRLSLTTLCFYQVESCLCCFTVPPRVDTDSPDWDHLALPHCRSMTGMIPVIPCFKEYQKQLAGRPGLPKFFFDNGWTDLQTNSRADRHTNCLTFYLHVIGDWRFVLTSSSFTSSSFTSSSFTSSSFTSFSHSWQNREKRLLSKASKIPLWQMEKPSWT